MKLRVVDDAADIEFRLEKDGSDVRLYGCVVRIGDEAPILEITEDGFLRLFDLPTFISDAGIKITAENVIVNEDDAEEEK